MFLNANEINELWIRKMGNVESGDFVVPVNAYKGSFVSHMIGGKCDAAAIMALGLGIVFLLTSGGVMVVVRLFPKYFVNKAGLMALKRKMFFGEIGYCNAKGRRLLWFAYFLILFGGVLVAGSAYPLKKCTKPTCIRYFQG